MKVYDLIQELMQYPEGMEVVGYLKDDRGPAEVYVGTTWCDGYGCEWADENEEGAIKVVQIEVSY